MSWIKLSGTEFDVWVSLVRLIVFGTTQSNFSTGTAGNFSFGATDSNGDLFWLGLHLVHLVINSWNYAAPVPIQLEYIRFGSWEVALDQVSISAHAQANDMRNKVDVSCSVVVYRFSRQNSVFWNVLSIAFSKWAELLIWTCFSLVAICRAPINWRVCQEPNKRVYPDQW